MKQQEFLDKLKSELEKYGQHNNSEILSDYAEHFAHGLRNGKTEEDISAKLGNPSTIAKAFEAEHLLKSVSQPQANQTTSQFATICKVLGKLIIIAPLNFFMIFIPGAIIFSLLMSGWAIAAGLVAACVAVVVLGFKFSVFAIGAWGALAFISGSFAIFFLAVFVGLVLYMISKFVIEGMIQYLRWNLKFVLEK